MSVLTSPAESLPHQPLDYAPRKSGFRIPRWLKFVTVCGVVVFLLGSILLPSLCGSRETANRVKCAANLKQIGNALTLFAHDHNGQSPKQLSDLIETEDLTPAVFVCPSGIAEASTGQSPAQLAADMTSPKYCSYVYLRENAGKADKAVVYELPEDHNEDGINVLYGDGHAEFEQCSRPEMKAALVAIGIPSEALVKK